MRRVRHDIIKDVLSQVGRNFNNLGSFLSEKFNVRQRPPAVDAHDEERSVAGSLPSEEHQLDDYSVLDSPAGAAARAHDAAFPEGGSRVEDGEGEAEHHGRRFHIRRVRDRLFDLARMPRAQPMDEETAASKLLGTGSAAAKPSPLRTLFSRGLQRATAPAPTVAPAPAPSSDPSATTESSVAGGAEQRSGGDGETGETVMNRALFESLQQAGREPREQ